MDHNYDSSKGILKDIGSYLSGGINKKSFISLYKAEKVAPNVKEFHEKCDSKGPTLTLLDGKYNVKFGGYTSQDWRALSKRHAANDEQAFLFYKNENEGATCKYFKVKEKKAEKAITCDENFGPTFGANTLTGSYDLQVFKNSKELSVVKDGYICLNGQLHIGNAYSAIDEPQGARVHNRDINAGKLEVRKLEVFQVVDDELSKPWKQKLKDEEFDNMKKKLVEMEPVSGLGIEHYNILLIGAVGVGKSSFYNTISTVFSEKVMSHAPAMVSESSVTNEFKAYKIVTENEAELCVRIFDIRGFEPGRGYEHELEPIIKGKLPIGYKFPEKSVPVENVDLRAGTLNDQIHLICFLTGPTDDIGPMGKYVVDIKKTTNKMGLPLVVVATKFDEQCDSLSEDEDHIYKCNISKKAAEQIKDYFQVQTNHVLPVVNYTSEESKSKWKEKLTLQALLKMIELAEQYLVKHKDKVVKPNEFEERHQILYSRTNQLADLDVEVTQMIEKVEANDTEKRILCVGPVHSGKTSLIYSLISVLMRQICQLPIYVGACGGLENLPNTERFQMYEIGKKRSGVYFGDTPGLEKNHGISIEYIKDILDGNNTPQYNAQRPNLNNLGKGEQFHCVCFVFDCVSVDKGLPVKENETILRLLDEKGIPYIVILTRGDDVSEMVKLDKLDVYKSRSVWRCVQTLITKFGFKQSKIFPIINYINENKVDNAGDYLLLVALIEMMKLGKSRLQSTDERAETSYDSNL